MWGARTKMWGAQTWGARTLGRSNRNSVGDVHVCDRSVKLESFRFTAFFCKTVYSWSIFVATSLVREVATMSSSV